MRKIKIFLTYLTAIICICMTLFYKPKETMVFETITRNLEDKITIFMLDDDKQLVPVSISYQKSKQQVDNIINIFQLMKQSLDVNNFEKIIPDSIQCLGVEIINNVVKINVNEALYTMNSNYELKFLEGIVGSIILLDQNLKVEFYVNGNKVERMPLSGLVMKPFDFTLGINNFELDIDEIHLSKAMQVVSLKMNQNNSYYIITNKRISIHETTESFVNNVLHEISYELNCEKIEFNNEIMVLHLNEAFLLDENTIDKDKIICLLYTLKLNKLANQFEIIVNGENKTISGFSSHIIYFEDLNLNVFEV